MATAFCLTPLVRTAACSFAPASVYSGTQVSHKRKHIPHLSLILDNVQGSDLKDSSPEPITRRLILLRHAESSWSKLSLRDHDRPLSNAGRADAVNVAHQLQELGWIPELILCSDAMRTRETLSIMQEQLKALLKAAVHFIPSFYSVAAMDGQTAEHLQKMICKLSGDDILTIMCMGHNKGWEEAASVLTGSVIELNTCNAALLEATGKSWEEAFASSEIGGWKLQGIVKPISTSESYVPT